MGMAILNKFSAHRSGRVSKQIADIVKSAEEILYNKDTPLLVRRVDACPPQIVNVAHAYGHLRNLAPYCTSRKKAEKQFGKGMFKVETIYPYDATTGLFQVPSTVFEAHIVGVAASATEFDMKHPKRALPLYAQRGPDRGRFRVGPIDIVFTL